MIPLSVTQKQLDGIRKSEYVRIRTMCREGKDKTAIPVAWGTYDDCEGTSFVVVHDGVSMTDEIVETKALGLETLN